jgi:hypothetical protein
VIDNRDNNTASGGWMSFIITCQRMAAVAAFTYTVTTMLQLAVLQRLCGNSQNYDGGAVSGTTFSWSR